MVPHVSRNIREMQVLQDAAEHSRALCLCTYVTLSLMVLSIPKSVFCYERGWQRCHSFPVNNRLLHRWLNPLVRNVCSDARQTMPQPTAQALECVRAGCARFEEEKGCSIPTAADLIQHCLETNYCIATEVLVQARAGVAIWLSGSVRLYRWRVKR